MKNMKKALMLLLIFVLAFSLVACGKKLTPKEALKQSVETSFATKSATSKTTLQVNYNIPPELTEMLSESSMIPFPLDTFNGTKLTMDFKTNLDQKRMEGKVATNVMGMALNSDIYMNDKLMAFNASPFLPQYIRMTNEDMAMAFEQSGQVNPFGNQAFFEMIFNPDSEEMKKNKEMSKKIANLMINSLKDEYIKDNGEVDFQGELIKGKFRELSIEFDLSKLFDIVYDMLSAFESDEEIIKFMVDEGIKTAKANDMDASEITVEKFKEQLATAKEEFTKNKDEALKSAEFVSLAGSKFVIGLDKDNNVRYSKMILSIDADLNKAPDAPMTFSQNLKLDLTAVNEVDAINKTEVAEQQFDDINSKPFSSLMGM